jgi:MFS-type transporter involved in bile tolerance (Atg22 family)
MLLILYVYAIAIRVLDLIRLLFFASDHIIFYPSQTAVIQVRVTAICRGIWWLMLCMPEDNTVIRLPAIVLASTKLSVRPS